MEHKQPSHRARYRSRTGDRRMAMAHVAVIFRQSPGKKGKTHANREDHRDMWVKNMNQSVPETYNMIFPSAIPRIIMGMVFLLWQKNPLKNAKGM